jgi:hypothetical protein
MKRIIAIVILLLAASWAVAQQSATYTLEEYAFNAAGRPHDGVVAGSPSYTITMDSTGDAMRARDLGSASYGIGSGFVSAYPPPGEITGLMFVDHQTLQWDPERSAGVYNLYRDLVSNLTGLGYGLCDQHDLTATTTTDTGTPPIGDGYFYLATVENRLGEEGTKGADGFGGTRPNPSPCP